MATLGNRIFNYFVRFKTILEFVERACDKNQELLRGSRSTSDGTTAESL
jgi:hypothetical protein